MQLPLPQPRVGHSTKLQAAPVVTVPMLIPPPTENYRIRWGGRTLEAMPFSEINRKIDKSELGMSAQIERGNEWISIREFLKEHARIQNEFIVNEKARIAEEQSRKAQEAAEAELRRQAALEHERLLNENTVTMKQLEIERIRAQHPPAAGNALNLTGLVSGAICITVIVLVLIADPWHLFGPSITTVEAKVRDSLETRLRFIDKSSTLSVRKVSLVRKSKNEFVGEAEIAGYVRATITLSVIVDGENLHWKSEGIQME